jgi:hypothetical protein
MAETKNDSRAGERIPNSKFKRKESADYADFTDREKQKKDGLRDLVAGRLRIETSIGKLRSVFPPVFLPSVKSAESVDSYSVNQ